ncbi:2805_t:CDS:2, partial [Gigaspora rosea]
YDGTIVKYIEWRDTVERAFTIKELTTLMIFGRYSGNPDDGYVCVEKGHYGTRDAANHSQAESVVNLNRQVFAIIATKLKGTALSKYKTSAKRANCWWRGDINDDAPTINALKDRTNYPHDTAKASAFKNGLSTAVNTAPAATIVQISFREILDEQFITEAVQETYQQQFLRFKFIPNWNDENSYDKYMNKFEELKTLANYQYATNFKSGPYTNYKMRLPPKMKERLTFLAGLGNVQTETQFWQQTSAIFHSLQQNKPTKKYSVHKEQKDIREKTTDDLKENWVNQKYNRKLHEYFTNKLLSEDFNKCVKKLKKQTLRKYAKDEIEDIDNERKKWVKDREEESLKEITNSENILIPYGMQFENPEINDLATQLQGIALNEQQKLKDILIDDVNDTLEQFEKVTPENSTGKAGGSNKTKPPSPKMGTIIKQRLSDWEQEIKKAKDFEDPRISKQFEYLKDRLNQIENRRPSQGNRNNNKVQVPQNTETKRETTYRYLKGLSDTNDLTIYKQRKRIKELEEEYEKDMSSALTMTNEQFAKLTAWDQRNVLDELVQGAAYSKNEAIRQQNHNNHMELIREQAELTGEMITEQLETAKEQQIRKQISKQRSKLKKPEKLNLPEKIFPTGWTGGLKQKEQPPHSPSKPSSLRNSIDIAQDELEEILKPSPRTQLEPEQTLSIPPQRPKIQRKILPQRSYSPLSSDLLQKRTYSPIPNEQLEQKKFREHTPTPPPPEQGPSKIREVLLLHDEITQQLESPEFWEDAKIPKMPRYNPKVTTKSNFDSEEYMPIQNTFRGQTYTKYVKLSLEKELPSFFDKNNDETVKTEENKGFRLSSSEEDEKRHEKKNLIMNQKKQTYI